MKGLAHFKTVIYDTNCVVYQCFKSTVKGRLGNVEIDSKPFTDIVKKITQYISDNNKMIYILKIAVDEVNKKKMIVIVRDRLHNPEIRSAFGLQALERFPEDIEFAIIRKLKQKIIKFQYEVHVELDNNFAPTNKELVPISNFFDITIPGDSVLNAKYDPRKCPAYVDKSLILYSKLRSTPLITNDRGIYDFAVDLENRNLSNKIFPLTKFA